MHGRESLKGEFESTSAIRSVTPEFVPKPIAWGTYKSVADTHFYLAEFQPLGEDLPEPPVLCERLAMLHKNGTSPNGKFGFHAVTYNGDLPQDNTYTDTWEEFFANGLRHMLNINLERGGPCKELDAVTPSMFEKVIPRLLRPLETGANVLRPSLVHGDLWCGNAAINLDDDMPVVFDPCCFWAHNECKDSRSLFYTVYAYFDADELGNWRPERNKFSRSFFMAYHSHVPKASPVEDYEHRNVLYSMQVDTDATRRPTAYSYSRFNLHAASLFPDVSSYRES